MTTENIVALIGAGAAILAAILAARSAIKASAAGADATRYAAILTSRADLAAKDKAVLVSTVTAERAVWRSEVRAAAAELVAKLRSGGAAAEWERVSRLLSEIALRLNPLGRDESHEVRGCHPLDRDIHMLLEQVLQCKSTLHQCGDDLASQLERAIALLLKKEWSVSKREAVTGQLHADVSFSER